VPLRERLVFVKEGSVTVTGTVVKKGGVQMIYIDSVKQRAAA